LHEKEQWRMMIFKSQLRKNRCILREGGQFGLEAPEASPHISSTIYVTIGMVLWRRHVVHSGDIRMVCKCMDCLVGRYLRRTITEKIRVRTVA
jgi:hypothetical protein